MSSVITQVHERTLLTSRSALVWLSLGVFTALLAGPFMFRMPCPDVSTFDYVAWRVLRGDTLYVDVVEQNWPGVMWLHTLANALFGNHLWSFRVVDFAVLLVGCAGLFQLARVGGSPATRYIVVPLYQAIYVSTDIWLVGQRDMLAGHVLLLAGALWLARMRGGSALLPPVVGAAMALASMTRPTYILLLPLLAGADVLLRSERRALVVIARDVVVAGLAFVGSIALAALLALSSGAFRGWYVAAVVFNTLLYSQTASFWDFVLTVWAIAPLYHWLVMLGTLGVVAWVRRGERAALSIVLCLVAVSLVSAFVQGKGLGYHLALLYPVLALFAAECLGAALALARARRSLLTRGVAAALCMIALLGGLKKLHSMLGPTARYLTGYTDRDTFHEQSDLGFGVNLADVLRAVDYARAHTTPEQTVLTWNRAVIINYLAERRLPTPIATVGMLDLLRDSFASGRVWLDDFRATLRSDPPALVFTYNERIPDEHERLWKASDDARATLMVREVLSARYRRVARFGALDAYALK